jgi:prepilin-type N-terminal cleavage/methylation domain-containing protein
LQGRRHAYSLIELLAVMAILSALAGLTVGSLSPVRANALTTGGNQLADVLTLARQNSLAHHAFTAVVIKSTGDSRYSSFCQFELTRNDDGTFAAWKMTAPWRSLPEGVRFDPDPLTGPAANFVNISPRPSIPLPLPATVQFRGQTINLPTDVAYQVFGPDGTLTKRDPVRLRLVHGTDDSEPASCLRDRKRRGDPANYYDIVILAETGQVR